MVGLFLEILSVGIFRCDTRILRVSSWVDIGFDLLPMASIMPSEV